MTEMRLALSLSAIEAMVHGDELVFDCAFDDEVCRVYLRCDDDALTSLREQVQRAMLHYLPTDGQKH